jgi:hypothetical protein
LSSRVGAGPLERIDRALGGRAPVVPLFEPNAFYEPTVWMSWYELWRQGRPGDLNLLQMSASFYWGVAYRARTQLLRLEWMSLEESPENAPQPHWQIDTEMLGILVTPGVIPDRADSPAFLDEGLAVEVLDDLDSERIAVVSMNRMHLGMAGWRNSLSPSSYWQTNLGGNEAKRREWFDKTMTHVVEQFRLVAVTV